jgi:outer membrane protein assembly factor BamB
MKPSGWTRRTLLCGLATTLACAVAGRARAGDWPQWRGPLFNGSSPETNLPARWSKTENIAWVSPLPGDSGATPIIWEGAIFLPSPDLEKRLWLYCLDGKDGRVRWRRQVSEGNRILAKNTMTSPSPVTDGRRVVALFGTGDLVAFDLEGHEQWHRNLAREFGRFANMFLYGSSPLLWDGRLYVQVLQRNPPTYPHALDERPARESFLLCLDPATGHTIWRHVRTTSAEGESMESYTTPLPYPSPGAAQLIVVGADCVTSHDASTGTELWRFHGLNPRKVPGGRIIPSAVAAPGLVFACGPKNEGLVALSADAAPGAGEPPVAWRLDESVPDVCTPLYYQGWLFVLDGDRQVLTCLDPRSGTVRWRGNLGVREVFSASPTGADGKLYCLSEKGTAVVLSAGAQFERLATVSMGEWPCMSSIAVSDGRLYVRTGKNLYCIACTLPSCESRARE